MSYLGMNLGEERCERKKGMRGREAEKRWKESVRA